MVSFVAEPIFKIGNFVVTNSILDTLVVDGVIVSGIVVLRKKINLIPNYFQNAIESLIELFYDLTKSISPPNADLIFPFFMTFFLFILLANWSGLIPGVGTIGFFHGKELTPLFRPTTSDFNTTLGLALVSVIATQYYGLKKLGLWGYATHYFHNSLQGNIGLVLVGFIIATFVGVLEIILEFVKIISLSFRLFGNIYAGEAVLSTISTIFAYILPLPFYALEIIVGLVQSLVFAMLTMAFMAIITSPPHEEAKEVSV